MRGCGGESCDYGAIPQWASTMFCLFKNPLAEFDVIRCPPYFFLSLTVADRCEKLLERQEQFVNSSLEFRKYPVPQCLSCLTGVACRHFLKLMAWIDRALNGFHNPCVIGKSGHPVALPIIAYCIGVSVRDSTGCNMTGRKLENAWLSRVAS